MRHTARSLCAVAALMTGSAAGAQELTIWHDKGDDGLAMVKALSAKFAQAHPGVSVTSVSMPTDQWFSKSIAALNTSTGPDIIFNDNGRIATVQQSTGKLCDLTETVANLPEGDRAQLTDGDIAAGTLDGELLMVPFQRVITGFGARKSWLDAVGAEFPKTWDDMLATAQKFVAEDPDGNGKDDTYGIAMQGGGAGNMIGAGTKLFAMGGNGAEYDIIDADGKVVLTDPPVAEPTIDYLKLYQGDLMSPSTVNDIFTDMYQLIEGGRVGFFRIGNWNVGKWDSEALKGDYVVGGYPVSPAAGDREGGMLVGSVRGMAIPCDGDHVDLAKEFVAVLPSLEAQQISLENMGGIVRDDVDISGVTPGLTKFVDGSIPLNTDHFLQSVYPWYDKLQESLYVEMSGAIASPPADWNAWLSETADKMQSEVDKLKAGG